VSSPGGDGATGGAAAGGTPSQAAGVTPSQTVGPYFAIGLTWDDGEQVVPDGMDGAFWIRGQVLDGAGDPIPDAVIETWQADPDGRFNHPDDPRGAVEWGSFRGLGRSGTDDQGHYAIYTVRPGSLPAPGGATEAPHIDVSVMARGLLARLATRIYFPEESAANAADPVLSSLPESADASTLIAVADGDGGYRFDIRLQGGAETVFFAV
jgi:protocatechuate 3,4-dioxygenase alpha subunit